MGRMAGERHREVQTIPRQWRRWGFAGTAVSMAGLAWAVSMDPPGTTLGTVAAVLGFAALLLVGWMVLSARLVVAVTDPGIEVRWWIFIHRTISRDEITSVKAATYEPMREFGGWGIRLGRGGSRAYSMAGDRGVEIILTNGKRVVLGSLDPDPLAAAINAWRDSPLQ